MPSKLLLVLAVFAALTSAAHAQDPKPYTGAACSRPVDDFFVKEVWTKVAFPLCVQCHKVGGDAEDSKLVLKDLRKLQGHAQDEAMQHNRDALAKLAKVKDLKAGNKSRLLVKPAGGLEHGGGDVLKPGSKGLEIMTEFVRRIESPATKTPVIDDKKLPPFFEGVLFAEPQRLWRRVALSLAGRLPTDAEKNAVAAKGQGAFGSLLDSLMTEEAFYERLREGFNDVFLTDGLGGALELEVYSHEHYNKTRLWTQKHDLTAVPEKERQKARYKLDNDHRKALLGEPLMLVDHIVRLGKPFTEIVTADYIMVTPYTAKGYGVFDELKPKFKNADDPFEYVPVKLKAMKGRGKATDQESATGDYPHAGILTTFQYMRRYPTTETNRNRLRARMFYLHFLGVDALELAARVSDAAAVSAKYAIPTMQASECVVCHKTLDPVASMWQDFYNFEGTFGRRKEGWYKDMFQAGFEGEKMDAKDRWRSLQWLGERTAKDPRFAVAMVEHVYYVLTGRKVLLAPKDLEDSLYAAKRRAYQEQRNEIERIAEQFAKSGFNLKQAFKDWIASDFYRVDGIVTAVKDPARRAELDDVGIVRMLGPEQVERKIHAIFGQRWDKLHNQMAILYGGIDSKEVTERAADPSGAMGAIQRIMSNDVACKHVVRDFALKPADRRLFPGIEPSVVPGTPEADAQIRRAMVHLHERLLGRTDAADSKEIDRTFELFAGIVADAKKQKVDVRDSFCRGSTPDVVDRDYTYRAWRAVVTYLLRRPEFLYE